MNRRKLSQTRVRPALFLVTMPAAKADNIITRSMLLPILVLLTALLVANEAWAGVSTTLLVIQSDELDGLRAPWYDSEDGTVKPVGVPELNEVDSSTRTDGWVKPVKPASGSSWWDDWWGNGSSSSSTTTGNSIGSGMSMFVSALMWGLLALAAIGLFALMFFILFRKGDREKEKLNFKGDDSLDTARVEILPFEVGQAQGDLLAQAQAARDAGRLKEAIVYLFAYLLLKLEKHQWIRLARGKTNRGYLREIRGNSELRGLVEGVVVTFEDVFFGALEPDHAEFDRCWEGLGEFHRIVEGGPT